MARGTLRNRPNSSVIFSGEAGAILPGVAGAAPSAGGFGAEPKIRWAIDCRCRRLVCFCASRTSPLRASRVFFRPLMKSTTRNTWYGGTPIGYTAADGSGATVAHYEHTAIIVGYDEYSVTLVDGGQVYWRSNEAFRASWGVLNNMAVIKD